MKKEETQMMREMVGMLRSAADQMAVALDQLQSGRNDGWVREYYRETLVRLREDLTDRVKKFSHGNVAEQLYLLDTEND
tara:strand:+ start:281 stop:517 length:237 start_codon:yes stop_codon:yes gene_type:complete